MGLLRSPMLRSRDKVTLEEQFYWARRAHLISQARAAGSGEVVSEARALLQANPGSSNVPSQNFFPLASHSSARPFHHGERLPPLSLHEDCQSDECVDHDPKNLLELNA